MHLTYIDEFDLGNISPTFEGTFFDTNTVSFHDHRHFELGRTGSMGQQQREAPYYHLDRWPWLLPMQVHRPLAFAPWKSMSKGPISA